MLGSVFLVDPHIGLPDGLVGIHANLLSSTSWVRAPANAVFLSYLFRVKLEAISSDFVSKSSIGASTSLLTRVEVLNPLDKTKPTGMYRRRGLFYVTSVGSSG